MITGDADVVNSSKAVALNTDSGGGHRVTQIGTFVSCGPILSF
jgi:hypothetical protein